jgi:hypothetical protein
LSKRIENAALAVLKRGVLHERRRGERRRSSLLCSSLFLSLFISSQLCSTHPEVDSLPFLEEARGAEPAARSIK